MADLCPRRASPSRLPAPELPVLSLGHLIGPGGAFRRGRALGRYFSLSRRKGGPKGRPFLYILNKKLQPEARQQRAEAGRQPQRFWSFHPTDGPVLILEG